MNTKDNFAITAFRVLITSISIAIMFPFVEHTSNASFYVTIIVFVLGKFVEIVFSLSSRPLKIMFKYYVAYIFLSIVIISMCFFSFLETNMTTESSAGFNLILYCCTIALGFFDMFEFIYCTVKLYATIKTLKINESNRKEKICQREKLF